MSTKLMKLEDFGCDVTAALARLLGDEAFLLSCVEMVAEDPAFEDLGACLHRDDIAGAFDAAHSLKGIAGNTGLTPLYELLIEIVEPLRNGTAQGVMPYYEKLMQKHKELLIILAG